MIVQTTANGQPAFVITMAQHTRFSGDLAEHFGNGTFESVEPREEMLLVIKDHDVGWQPLDERAPADPDTGLPFHLVKTPFEEIVATSSASPERNSQVHPYCGLISSMHSWGLYNGRYGMSDMILLDNLAGENRTVADRLLEGEIARQDVLKSELSSDPSTATWLENDRLFQNYKQLQFFDTMALYFNCTLPGTRSSLTFTHVPKSKCGDTEVTINPKGDETYALSPFPFAEEGLELSFEGRYLAAGHQDASGNLGRVLQDTSIERQTVRLVSA
jgi:hypothetical protein